MSRKSRKLPPVIEENANVEQHTYKVGIYARNSKRNNGCDEFESMESQIRFLKNYVDSQPDMELYSVYSDNGNTGVNFLRPDFKKMIADINNKNIDCIVVKDLSRFGRNCVEMNDYVEALTLLYNIRFIAVIDKYDTINADDKAELLYYIKNIANEMIARKISKNIKDVFENKRINGEPLHTSIPYGYNRNPIDKNGLIIDKYSSEIVKTIFLWRSENLSFCSIANKLNAMGTPSPKQYRSNRNDSVIPNWTDCTVKQITNNIAYLGHSRNGIYKSTNYVKKKQPESKWVIIKNTHEPIINEELFNAVRQINARTKEKYKCHNFSDKQNNDNNLFKGLLKCGICNSRLKLINKHKYYCQKCKRQNIGFKAKKIDKSVFIEAVLSFLSNYILFSEKISFKLKSIESNIKIKEENNKLNFSITELNKKLDKLKFLKLSLLESYNEKLITIDEFNSMKYKYQRDIDSINEKINILRNKIVDYKKIEQSQKDINKIIDFKEIEQLDRKTVEQLIDSIYVYDVDKLKINFSFINDYKNAIDILKRAGESI